MSDETRARHGRTLPDEGHGRTLPDEGHVLVVGATRLLRPAVRELAGRGVRVTAVARTGAALAALARECGGRVTPLAVDATRPGLDGELRRAGGAAGFTGALLYTPALPEGAATGRLPEWAGGPCVLLLPSRWAAPEATAEGSPGQAGAASPWSPALLPRASGPERARRRLVLGWHRGPEGTRWHTPEEISAAALALLDAPHRADEVLGAVRPWAERPV